MVWTAIGALGTIGSTTANQSTLTLVTSAACEVDHVCVVLVAVDNNQTTDGDEGAVSGVASGTNTFSKMVEFTNGQGAAQGGTTVSMWYCQCTAQINSGANIVISFTNATSRDASCATAHEFSVSAGSTVTNGATNTLATDAGTLTSAAALTATTPNRNALRIRASSGETNSSTNIGATNANWTRFTNTRSSSGTAASNQIIVGEFTISTGTTDNSDCTHATSADWASAYGTLYENLRPSPSGVANAQAIGTHQLNRNITLTSGITI